MGCPKGAAVTKLRVSPTENDSAGRKLERWQEQEQTWMRIGNALSKAVGRQSDNHVMSDARTATVWRQKLEETRERHNALSINERAAGGSAVWEMSLRDNWTRYVPLGNRFSGLNVELNERPPAHAATDWEIILKPTPDDCLGGSDMGPLPESSPDCVVGEVESKHKPRAMLLRGFQLSSDKSSSQDQPPMATARALAEVPQPLNNTASISKKNNVAGGPRCATDTDQIFLTCAAGSSAVGTVHVSNTGTTALYYHWQREASSGPALLHPFVSSTPPVEACILPGQIHAVRFTFGSSTPGVYTDKWLLITRPQAPSIVKVTIRGACFVEAEHVALRQQLADRLSAQVKVQEVERAVQAILATVCCLRPRAQYGARLADGDAENETFCQANVDTQPDVYYSPAVVKELVHIHDTAHKRVAEGLLQAASTAQASAGKAAKAKLVASTPTTVQPPQCNGNFMALENIVQQVHAYDPTLHEALSSSLHQLRSAASQPPDPHAVVTRSAYNAVVGAMNDAELYELSDAEPHNVFCTALLRCADELQTGTAARSAQAVTQLEADADLASAAAACLHGGQEKEACLWQAMKALAKTDSFLQTWAQAS